MFMESLLGSKSFFYALFKSEGLMVVDMGIERIFVSLIRLIDFQLDIQTHE